MIELHWTQKIKYLLNKIHYLTIIFAIFILSVFYIISIGCVSDNYKFIGHTQDLQDPNCYKSYKGEQGYCDKRITNFTGFPLIKE